MLKTCLNAVLLAGFALCSSSFAMGHASAESAATLAMVAGIHTKAEISIVNAVVTYDLLEAGPESTGAETARTFMQEMAKLSGRIEFVEVVLAYKGAPRYRIGGRDIRTLADGFVVGDMSAFHRLMLLPSILQTLDARRAYNPQTGNSVAAMAARAEDFNQMISHWYLNDLLEELNQASP